MPELPEVETIVRDLNKKVHGEKIADVWTDWPKYFKRSKGGFEEFKKIVKGKKIKKIRRLGKNIIFDLSDDKKMLIHQKLTGHLLVGHWQIKNNKPISTEEGPLTEKVNDYIHAIFWLGKNKMMGFSDLRKFGKILAVDKKDFENLEDVKNIGPDPLTPNFKFTKFRDLMSKKRGPIKKVLMDQDVISGIGNIYSDEILFVAKIHPLKKAEKLGDKELRAIFGAAKKILKKAVKLRGASISDYRDTAGKAGRYTEVRLVYQREGEKCPRLRQGFGGQARRCDGVIKRIKIGGRSAHFCPHCQIYA
ncbi:MAG: bifunctional DNA-formamidopyrimidine glycosylase/DNA-(apurinic or apyrimidinic site) lyase [Candidatus Azambacteria bacterium]|nr:bifunctional DNA-formamidopyrimidine glycosylase/DNA-(apurinic or apyrimidinic site) lyase [Candidatus Azambacteria bacterium]